jgi:hypothetical protein
VAPGAAAGERIGERTGEGTGERAGEGTGRLASVHLDLAAAPEDGARVLVVLEASADEPDGRTAPRRAHRPERSGRTRPRHRPPLGFAELELQRPRAPDEIIAASGIPGARRPTPSLDSFDWVRVFGPMGTEDRSEHEPDGLAWRSAATGVVDVGPGPAALPAPPVGAPATRRAASAPSAPPGADDAVGALPAEGAVGERSAGAERSLDAGDPAALSLTALVDALAPVPAPRSRESRRRRRRLRPALIVGVPAALAAALLAAEAVELGPGVGAPDDVSAQGMTTPGTTVAGSAPHVVAPPG